MRAKAFPARVPAAIAAAFFLLGGCAAPERAVGPPQPAASADAVESVRVRFVAGGPVNVITVTVVDAHPLRAAALIAPDGVGTPAYSIDTGEDEQTVTTPAGGAFPDIQGEPIVTSQRDTTVSTALIRLPDPVAYVRDWRNFRIRLLIGDPDSPVDEMTLRAPAPPRSEI